MNFETYINRQLDETMTDELCMKIGDLVVDREVNLEGLVGHSAEQLQHLYRLMVENPELELKCIDDLALYFIFRQCNHEYYLPWWSVVEEVRGRLEDGRMGVKCVHCNKQQKLPQTKETTMEKKTGTIQTEGKKMNIDINKLQFLFLSPETKLLNRRVRSEVRSAKLGLSAYKKAVADGNEKQAKGAKLALKRALDVLRNKMGVKCAVKEINN